MIAVTGASGFVGRALVRDLVARGRPVRALVRTGSAVLESMQVRTVVIGDLGARLDCPGALAGVDCLVHCAARVHRLDERTGAALQRYRQVNVAGSLRLAELAAAQGVRRFVFISSIKVLAERTAAGAVLTGATPPAPVDPYGISKLEAETALARLCAASGIELVVIRPTLVHGPGAGGNLERLLRVLHRGWPLPLAGIDNARSMLSLGNLVDLIVHASTHPAAAGAVLLAADPTPVSTSRLLHLLAAGLDRPARLFHLPPQLLRAAAAVTGRSAMVGRLLDDLQVDVRATCERLDWRPPVAAETSLRQMAGHWLRLQ